MQRPNKPVFTLHVNPTFTETVDVELPELADDVLLLDEDWADTDSYSTYCRDQFAPLALEEFR